MRGGKEYWDEMREKEIADKTIIVDNELITEDKLSGTIPASF